MCKMVFATAIAEYKLEINYRAPTTIMVARTTEVAIESSKAKVYTRLVEL